MHTTLPDNAYDSHRPFHARNETIQQVSDFPWIQLTFLGLVAFVALQIRTAGMYPSIFADEYSYSRYSRLEPIADAQIPAYLYFATYSLTRLCGDGFLACAKTLNILFLVLSIPLLYQCARLVLPRTLAVYMSTLAVLSPANAYTAYFMPESMYYFGFWLMTYLLLRVSPSSQLIYLLIPATALGTLMLVKPHGIFLTPAALIYIFWLYRSANTPWQNTLRATLTFIATVAVTRLLLGYVLAGPGASSVFGPLYTSIASTSADQAISSVQVTATLTLFSVMGHVQVLALLYGVPLGCISSIMLLHSNGRQPVAQPVPLQELRKQASFATLIIASLILVSATFTAFMEKAGDPGSILRIHMRYYNFALPLLYVISAGLMRTPARISRDTSRKLIGFTIVLLAAYTIYTGNAPFVSSLCDNPDLHGIRRTFRTFLPTSMMLLATTLIWCVSPARAIAYYLYIALPAVLLVSGYSISTEQRSRLHPDAFDKAGMFARQFLTLNDADRLLVVGSAPASVLRTLFYIDSPRASHVILGASEPYDLAKTPLDKDWVLLVGDHSLIGTPLFSICPGGFTLARRCSVLSVDFTSSSWPVFIESVEGLSHAEAWGTWTDAQTVEFIFRMPLPKHFTLRLLAAAYGRNVGKDVSVSVGDDRHTIIFSAEPEERTISVHNVHGESRVRLTIPDPTTPSSIGAGCDDRQLGLGLLRMSIEPAP